jgi:pyruvate/2-oxoglutarate dehydrogenase complex dihydrolipoamide dehydrogenase (E3) component
VLLDRGSEVELVSRWPTLFPGTLTTLDMAHLYGRLLGKGLTFRLNAWAGAVEGDRVTTFNLYTGATEVLEGVDTVVLATGAKANDELYLALKDEHANVHRIGDCLAPRKLDHAIYEGELAGRELFSPEERYIYEGELERFDGVPVEA